MLFRSDRNLRNMRAFYQVFPIWHAVRTELSWTHYRALLRVTSKEAREWYVNESASQNWSARALDRQIGTLYFEHLLLSSDKTSVEAEADANIAALPCSPREFVRDPVMLEFLGLPGMGKLLESKLEQELFFQQGIRGRYSEHSLPPQHKKISKPVSQKEALKGRS